MRASRSTRAVPALDVPSAAAAHSLSVRGGTLAAAWRRGSALVWLLAAAVALVAIAIIDLNLPSNANIDGALVLIPFLAAGGAAPQLVAGTGLVSIGCAVGLAVADGSGLQPSIARILAVAVGTAVAVEAAVVRLRRERRLVDLTVIAEAAQQAIIRRPPGTVGDCEVATWYQSSHEAATVGGDCFEVLDTPFGTRVLMGDVRGHGLPSVRLATRVLGGFRALAYMTPDLDEVAYELDLLAARYADEEDSDHDGEEFVTALLAEFTPGVITVANCGHPAPLVVSPDGAAATLDASVPAPPLGLGMGANRPLLDRFALDPGARVLLYTDGLVEARDRAGLFFDLPSAGALLAEIPLPDAVERLIDALNAHAAGIIRDDVALVLVEPGSGEPGEALASALVRDDEGAPEGEDGAVRAARVGGA
ncbi:MAG TPA: PP2C family protein-serine/threonine phosphatase [Mycobacteriales bacterium]